MPAPYIWSSANCKAAWGAVLFWDDVDPEGGVQVVPDQDAWKFEQGCDGEVERVQVNSFPAKVSITLSQHTKANKDMLRFVALDALSRTVVFPFFLTDLQSGVSFAAPRAYIVGLPAHSFSRNTAVVIWTLQCDTLAPVPIPGQVFV